MVKCLLITKCIGCFNSLASVCILKIPREGEGHLAAANLIQNLQRHERPFHTGHDFSPPVKRFMSLFIPYFSIILPLPVCQGEG